MGKRLNGGADVLVWQCTPIEGACLEGGLPPEQWMSVGEARDATFASTVTPAQALQAARNLERQSEVVIALVTLATAALGAGDGDAASAHRAEIDDCSVDGVSSEARALLAALDDSLAGAG